MGCMGNVHVISFDDTDDPSGSHCECGQLSLFAATHDPHGRLIGLDVVVDDD
jgi:hypothetical protein